MAGETRGVKLHIENVVKEYKGEHGTTIALNGVNLDIMENEFVCVVGPSGCGKSTLLNILAGLHEATSGECYLDGERIVGTDVRRGVVFQQYALFPWLTVEKNVEFGLKLQGKGPEERAELAHKYLKMVDLESFAKAYPKELSGGMKQRVAIARALVNNPAVILADEATGNLDTRTSFEILVLFQKLHAEGRTLIFVTHNPEIAQYSSRNIRLRDGHVVEDTVNPQILSAAAALAALPKNDED